MKHGCRYVERLGRDYAWIALAPGLQARLHALDACADLPSLRAFPGDLQPGQLISASILQVGIKPSLNTSMSKQTCPVRELYLETCSLASSSAPPLCR